MCCLSKSCSMRSGFPSSIGPCVGGWICNTKDGGCTTGAAAGHMLGWPLCALCFFSLLATIPEVIIHSTEAMLAYMAGCGQRSKATVMNAADVQPARVHCDLMQQVGGHFCFCGGDAFASRHKFFGLARLTRRRVALLHEECRFLPATLPGRLAPSSTA